MRSPLAPIPTEIEYYGADPHLVPSRPMCMSCGLEHDHAAVIHFAHMCRWPDERVHDQVITICAGCLELARLAIVNKGRAAPYAEDPHRDGCECGSCRYKRGVCARCGKEPVEASSTWGGNCGLAAANEQRRRDGNPLLTRAEYDKITGGPA